MVLLVARFAHIYSMVKMLPYLNTNGYFVIYIYGISDCNVFNFMVFLIVNTVGNKMHTEIPLNDIYLFRFYHTRENIFQCMYYVSDRTFNVQNKIYR